MTLTSNFLIWFRWSMLWHYKYIGMGTTWVTCNWNIYLTLQKSMLMNMEINYFATQRTQWRLMLEKMRLCWIFNLKTNSMNKILYASPTFFNDLAFTGFVSKIYFVIGISKIWYNCIWYLVFQKLFMVSDW